MRPYRLLSASLLSLCVACAGDDDTFFGSQADSTTGDVGEGTGETTAGDDSGMGTTTGGGTTGGGTTDGGTTDGDLDGGTSGGLDGGSDGGFADGGFDDGGFDDGGFDDGGFDDGGIFGEGGGGGLPGEDDPAPETMDVPNWWDGQQTQDCPPTGTVNATVTGTVYAPNGELPVSGALVYLSSTPPDPIPQGVYCSTCLELDCDDVDSVTSAADGSFSISTTAADARYLVVRKGEFMRVTQLDVKEGDNTLDKTFTALPSANDPTQGQYIPKIALAVGQYDKMEDVLSKIGLGTTNDTGTFQPGSEQFDIWDHDGAAGLIGATPKGTLLELISDPEKLAQYHIIFIPCASAAIEHQVLTDDALVKNIRDWVEKGGRWYASDWSVNWIEKVFPDYQALVRASDGDPLLTEEYDADSTVVDPDLEAWLAALPDALKDVNPLQEFALGLPTLADLPNFLTTGHYSAVLNPLPQVIGTDTDGNPVNLGHRAWIEGKANFDSFSYPQVNEMHPLTVTGAHGCGKLQFTSYHTTDEAHVGLTPQELTLLYTIWEIGTCQPEILPD